MRPTVGYWFDNEHTIGIEGSLFFLERDSSILHLKRTTGNLYRLYIDAETGEYATEQFSGLLPSGVERRGSDYCIGFAKHAPEVLARCLFVINE